MAYRNEVISTAVKLLGSLLDRFSGLTTFAAVQQWDSEARLQIETILAAIAHVETDLNHSKRELEQHLSSLPMVRKLIPWDRKGSELRRKIQEIEELIAHCNEIVSEIQSRIDRTPNDKEEQKLLLQELKLMKKELQLEKKQVNSQMRNIRENASVRYAAASGGLTRLMGLTAAQRRDIRVNKEASLMPHKSERDFIEGKITILERQIHWVESIR